MIKKFCFSTINQTLQRMLFLHFEISGQNFLFKKIYTSQPFQDFAEETIRYIERFPVTNWVKKN